MASDSAASTPILTATFPVLDGEEPWTPTEVAEVKAELLADQARLAESIREAESDLAELMSEGSYGAGRDPADIGSSNFTREQELSLHNSMRATLDQIEQALRLLNEGGYGYCEVCGEAIGKARLAAFPRATMCVACKKRQERR